MEVKGYAKQRFTYAFPALTINSNVTINEVLQLDSEYAFVMENIFFTSKDAAFTENNNFTIQLVNTSSNEQIFSQPVFIEHAGSKANLNATFITPRRFESKSAVRLTLTNLHTAALTIQISLPGYRVIPLPVDEKTLAMRQL